MRKSSTQTLNELKVLKKEIFHLMKLKQDIKEEINAVRRKLYNKYKKRLKAIDEQIFVTSTNFNNLIK